MSIDINQNVTERDFIEALKQKDFVFIESAIEKLEPYIIADFVSVASYEQRSNFISHHINSEILAELPFHIQEEVINIIGIDGCVNLLANLPAEDIWNFVADRDKKTQQFVIRSMPYRVREILQEVLSYPEESAGRLINKDYVMIPKDWLVGQAVDLLRTYQKKPESLSQVFVLDSKMRPIGSVKLLELLCTRKNIPMHKIMQKEIIVIKSGMDQEEVAMLFSKHSLHSAPVTNENGKMIGIIHVDDVMKVLQEEAEEDMMHLGGVSESDVTASMWTTIIQRMPWLLVSFLAINLASAVIGLFDEVLNNAVQISILMPIVAAMGGNSGVQASTVAVRAIAIGQITKANSIRLMCKEIGIGLVNGFIISVVMFVIVLVRFQNITLAFIFASSVIISLTMSTFTGAAIPVGLKKIGVDPALASSVVTSAFSDMLGFSILLSIASVMLL